MIKFIYGQSESDSPTFGDVEIDQFFVVRGSLYQKMNNHCANKITDSNGEPYSESGIMFSNAEKISKILPKVLKIEF